MLQIPQNLRILKRNFYSYLHMTRRSK